MKAVREYGLEKNSFKKNARYAVDNLSYLDKLSTEEREWLNKFNKEYYGNYFEANKEHLHDTPELKKKCYSNENARNRDLYAIKGTANLMVAELDSETGLSLYERAFDPRELEDIVIEKLDKHRSKNKQ